MVANTCNHSSTRGQRQGDYHEFKPSQDYMGSSRLAWPLRRASVWRHIWEMEDTLKMVETGTLPAPWGPFVPRPETTRGSSGSTSFWSLCFVFHPELTMQPLTGGKDCLVSSAVSGVWHRAWLPRRCLRNVCGRNEGKNPSWLVLSAAKRIQARAWSLKLLS